MKVKEFIEALEALDQPESEVIMSKDSEGNRYSPFDGFDPNASYLAENTWSGEVGLRSLTPELEAKGYSEEDVVEGVAAVVLYPTC
jgi:hypothetical protein